jgi:NAD(P)-dependent dehydrogenase (short-subunit alcohol dehydrogenase family)
MTLSIENKNVLVTGANRGIGKAIVEEALQRGAAKVYAAVRTLESAQPLVEEYGDRIVPVHVDMTNEVSIKAAAETASDVEIVVNNAGVLTTTSAVDDNVLESLQFEFDVNVYGLVRMAKAFAPVLKSNGGGAFAQLNSVVSVKTFGQFATYSASKAASYSITQGLRESLKEQGTHIVSVHPGPIKTDMIEADQDLSAIAEPPSLVAKAIFDAVEKGEFHAWPDSMAKEIGGVYRSFAENVVEADMQETPA